MRRVEYVFPVVRASLPFIELLLRTPKFLGKLKDAPVVVGVLESARYTFMDADIVWDISNSVVIFMTKAAC